ncbi:MAG: excalibur calcium-binding domain-containing protein [Streptomyces sp.]|uniref:excalibur calcium-binding domain-containing protein n=1 Tax=Streptomyces sp. TaxID=1931 RepID=UPI0025E50D97|nr:excalibur calcium-binding domain-containing protein [Streptomyces sp.]MBW8793398.1 excalibur calcium-binding domain-containing protein [Streptomyces sp.]
MTNPYNAPQPGRRIPKWARKRVVLPALAVAFVVGIAAGGSGNDDKKNAADDKPRSTAAATVTATATVTETAAPEPAPTVTKTKTVKVRVTVTADSAGGGSVGSGDDTSGDGGTYYANCSAARAAGVTPLYRGDPGYDSHLDRDGDGVACE